MASPSFSGSALFASITFTSTQLGGAGTGRGLLSATGTFINQQNSVGTALNTVGSEVNFVANQISYNSDKVDALNTGLGALVDADLAQEFGTVAGAADPPAARHASPVAG